MKKFDDSNIRIAKDFYEENLYPEIEKWIDESVKNPTYMALSTAMPTFTQEVKRIYRYYMENPSEFREMDAAKYKRIESYFTFPQDTECIKGHDLFKKFFIEHLYEYHLVSQNREIIIKWAKKLRSEVCPYCNIDQLWLAEERNLARSPLDHWFPKKDYNIFSVFFYNLVPVCDHCNRVKGDAPGPHINPYFEDMDEIFTFRLSSIRTGFLRNLETTSCPDDNLFEIGIDIAANSQGVRPANTLEDLKILKKYNAKKSTVFNALRHGYRVETEVFRDISKIFENTNIDIISCLDKEKAECVGIPCRDDINLCSFSKIKRDLILGLIMRDTYAV